MCHAAVLHSRVHGSHRRAQEICSTIQSVRASRLVFPENLAHASGNLAHGGAALDRLAGSPASGYSPDRACSVTRSRAACQRKGSRRPRSARTRSIWPRSAVSSDTPGTGVPGESSLRTSEAVDADHHGFPAVDGSAGADRRRLQFPAAPSRVRWPPPCRPCASIRSR